VKVHRGVFFKLFSYCGNIFILTSILKKLLIPL